MKHTHTRAPYSIKVKWHDFLSEDGKVPSDEDAKKMCCTAFKAYGFDLSEISLPSDRGGPTRSGSLKRHESSHLGRSDNRRTYQPFLARILATLSANLCLSNIVIISSRSSHNATELCQKPNSYGPDFVSLEEGVYCNMDTRETLPLCASGVTVDCFNVETTSYVVRDGLHKPTIRARNPTNVIRW